MTIFDQLNDLLFSKKKKCMDNIVDQGEYSPFMINRWISMYSPEYCCLINNTVNWMHPVLDTKVDHYKFLHAVLPRAKWKRINYIKKKKPETKETEQDLSAVASTLELSEREVKYLKEQHEQACRY